jgi:hypothetical protein
LALGPFAAERETADHAERASAILFKRHAGLYGRPFIFESRLAEIKKI